MKNLIRLEELAMFGLTIFLFSTTPYQWWWYWVFILAPDIGMIGYVVGPRWGAITYNLFHHKAVALIILAWGFYAEAALLEAAGLILFGHSSMDRILGYGLKFPDAFKHTHLGWIGEDN